MRPAHELQQIVESTIRVSGGTAPFVIAAHDDREADALRALLKGKRGAKTIEVQTYKPEFFLAPTSWDDRPGTPIINPTK